MILNFLEFFEFQLSYHAYFYIPVKLFCCVNEQQKQYFLF